jgi:hypothetical protein
MVHAADLGHNVPAEQVDVRISLSQSAKVRETVSKLTDHVAEQPAPTGPVIQSVWNPVTKVPDTLNAGQMALIQGMRIAVRGEQTEDTGVFFTRVSGGATVHVPAAQLSPNTPTKLQFVLPPAVTPGEWTVAVATQSSSHSTTHLGYVRRGEYPQIITVV